MDNKEVYEINLRDLFSGKLKDAEKNANRFESTVNSLKGTLATLGVSFGAYAIGSEILNTTRQFDSLKNSLNFVAGSAEGGARDLQYLKDQSDKLGTSFESSASGFKTIAAAARGTALEGDQVKEIFEGISMASVTMGLGAEQSEGALLALSQMISKGKVQAEELRGQLGERIPGAFQIAARAMGMTTKALDKFMSDGKLVSEDFLPKFAAQLKKEFAEGAMTASDGLQSSLNRLNNEWLYLKQEIGEGLRPVMIDIIKLLRESITFVKEHEKTLKFLAVAIVGTALAFKLAAAAGFIYETVVGVQMVAALTGTTTATLALNAAMALTPWGLAALGIAAATAALFGLEEAKKRAKEETAKSLGTLENKELTLIKEKSAELQKQFKLTQDLANAKAIGLEKDLLMQEISKRETDKSMLALTAGMADQRVLDEQHKIDDLKARLGFISQDSIFDKLKSPAKGAPGKDGKTVEADKVTEPKHTVIHIQINKLVELMQIMSNNLTEGAQKTKEEMTKALIEAVNDSQIIAGG